jgi:hypothetical protein
MNELFPERYGEYPFFTEKLHQTHRVSHGFLGLDFLQPGA